MEDIERMKGEKEKGGNEKKIEVPREKRDDGSKREIKSGEINVYVLGEKDGEIKEWMEVKR